MDELDLLSRVRDDVPELDELTARRIRAAVLTPAPRIRAGVLAPAPRVRRARLRAGVAAAAVAAVLGGSVAVTGVGSGGDAPIGATAAAADVLNAAATAALRGGFPAAGPGQVLYRRTIQRDFIDSPSAAISLRVLRAGPKNLPAAHSCGSVTEVWAPADVKADGLSRQVGGLLRPGPEGDPAQEQKDPRCKPVANRTRLPAAAQHDTEELRALPMDPHALYEAVSKRVGYVGSPSNPGLTMLELTRLTTASASPLLTPRRIAALFRAMTYVPGVRLAGPGRDLLGRRGIVLEWSWSTGEVQQVIIDPHDGQVLGNRVVFTQDTETTQIRVAPHEPLKVTGFSARLVPAGSRWLDKATVTGVVDRIGQRP